MNPKPYNHSEASIKAGKDFATANKAAGLIHKVFRQHAKDIWDATFFNRLKKIAIQIVNTGPSSQKGNRQFTDGQLQFLKLLQFNPLKEFDSFKLSFNLSLEKSDFLNVTIDTVYPEKHIKFPSNATSVVFRFICGIFHFDLDKGGSTALKELEIFKDKIFPGASVKIPLQAAENSVICVALCLYYKKGASRLNRPANKCHAGKIISVYNIVDGKVMPYINSDDLPTNPSEPEQKPETPDWEIKTVQ